MNGHEHTISRRSFLASSALAATTAATAGLLVNPLQAHAVTAAQKQAEAAATLDKLNTLEEKLDEASADYGTALDEQQAAQERMDEAQSRIDQANIEITDLQDQLATRAKSMYRTGSLSFIDMLLGATSFQAFTTNWGILNSMNENDAKMVEDTKQLKSEIEEQKAVYTEQEAVAAEQARQAKIIQEEAQALVDEMQQTYDSLSAEAAELLRQEEEAREAEARRQAEEALARQQAAAAAAAAQQSSGSSGTSSSSSSGSSSSGSTASGGSGSVNNSKPQTVPGSTVVERAKSMLGKPYVWGAVGPNSFDCSGLVGYCLTGTFARHWTTYHIYNWTKVTDPQPGDLCIRTTHTGVYVGGGQMIHASTSGGVKYSAVPSDMFYVRY